MMHQQICKNYITLNPIHYMFYLCFFKLKYKQKFKESKKQQIKKVTAKIFGLTMKLQLQFS